MVESVRLTRSQLNTLVRLGVALSLAGLFTAAVVAALSSRVPDVRDLPLARERPKWNPQTFTLPEVSGPQPPAYAVWLRPINLAGTLSHSEIRILVSTYGRRARLKRATLEAVGTKCTYATADGANFEDDALLTFFQGEGCRALADDIAGDVKLTVELDERQQIGVWTFAPLDGAAGLDNESIHVIDKLGSQGPFAVLRGRYVDYLGPARPRRIDLLSYMWQVSGTPNWIWAAVVVACMLLVVGALVTPSASIDRAPSRRRFAARSGLGTASIAAALGLMYAVIAPPFQAPDEPGHFLGFATLVENAALIEESREWAQRIHFERLRFHTDEKFRPVDVREPSPSSWHEKATAVPGRSSMTRFWLLIGTGGSRVSTQRTLLMLRVLNVLVFSVSVGVGVAAVALLTTLPVPQLVAFTFLFVPTLPFFGTHVSNYAFLTSAYILFSCAVVATIFDRGRPVWVGLFLGASVATMFLLSRSALPMIAMVAVVLAGRLLFGQGRRMFCVAFAGSALAVVATFIEPLYKDYVRKILQQYLAGKARLWWVAAGMSGAVAVTVAAVRARIAGTFAADSRRARMMERLSMGAGWCAAAAITAMVVLSVKVDLPTLAVFDETRPPPLRHYVRDALLAGTTIFRAQRPDYLTSTTFWSGFGWLDTILPDWVTITLTISTAFASVISLLGLAIRRNIVGILWAAAIAAGFVASLALYAVATATLLRDLHGRYLIGLYVVMLPLCWSVLMVHAPTTMRRGHLSRWEVFLSAALAIHAYSLSFVLGRYF